MFDHARCHRRTNYSIPRSTSAASPPLSWVPPRSALMRQTRARQVWKSASRQQRLGSTSAVPWQYLPAAALCRTQCLSSCTLWLGATLRISKALSPRSASSHSCPPSSEPCPAPEQARMIGAAPELWLAPDPAPNPAARKIFDSKRHGSAAPNPTRTNPTPATQPRPQL